MIKRVNSWNPNEDSRITLTKEDASEAFVYPSHYGTVINVKKKHSGFEYLYRNVTDESTSSSLTPEQSLALISNSEVRTEFNKFLETDRYVFMYKDSNIGVHPKGTKYTIMDGTAEKILDNQNDYGQENEVLGFMFNDTSLMLKSKQNSA